MLKKNKKQVIYAFVIVLVLFLISSLAIFVYLKNKDQADKNHWLSTNFKNSNEVTITSTLPISDALGKSLDGKGTEKGIQGYVEFSIKNNIDQPVEYEVLITKKELKKEIKGNYIKFYVTDEADNPEKGFEGNIVPTYNDLPSLTDLPGSRLLYSGKLNNNENKKQILRAWLSDSYAVSNDDNKFGFDIEVRAK